MHGFYCCRAEFSQTLRCVTTDEGLYYRAVWRLCKHEHFCASSELHRILDLAVIKGASGLRVVDASVFVRSYPLIRFLQPYITSARTQAPVYAVAERASGIIKAAYD